MPSPLFVRFIGFDRFIRSAYPSEKCASRRRRAVIGVRYGRPGCSTVAVNRSCVLEREGRLLDRLGRGSASRRATSVVGVTASRQYSSLLLSTTRPSCRRKGSNCMRARGGLLEGQASAEEDRSPHQRSLRGNLGLALGTVSARTPETTSFTAATARVQGAARVNHKLRASRIRGDLNIRSLTLVCSHPRP
jgi:hypothetical protein